MRIRQRSIVFFFNLKKKTCSRGLEIDSELGFEILERERVFYLKISHRFDCRFSTEQEAKSIYAAMAMIGHRFCEDSKTLRGKGLFLLVLFFC